MQQILIIEGKPEKDVGIIQFPSKNIKERVRSNHDSRPTSGMSTKGTGTMQVEYMNMLLSDLACQLIYLVATFVESYPKLMNPCQSFHARPLDKLL